MSEKGIELIAQEILSNYLKIHSIHPKWAGLMISSILSSAANNLKSDMPDDNAFSAGYNAALSDLHNIATQLDSLS